MPAKSVKSFTAQKLEKVKLLTFAVSNFREEGPALCRIRSGNLKGKPQTCQNAAFIIRDLLPNWLVPQLLSQTLTLLSLTRNISLLSELLSILRKNQGYATLRLKVRASFADHLGKGGMLILLMAINFISKPNPCPFNAFLGFPVLCSLPGDRACR